VEIVVVLRKVLAFSGHSLSLKLTAA